MKITKKFRLEQVRLLIDSKSIGEQFSNSDLNLLSEMLKTKVDGAFRKINPQFPSDPRHLVTLIDGEWQARSWRKIIEQTATPESEAKRVMRHLIADDLSEYFYSVEPLICFNCLSEEDLTVDHVAPPFSVIANDFIKSFGMPEIIDNSDTDKVTKCFSDIQLEANWIQFHSERAVYQILCRSCNASKGAKC